MTLLCLGFSYDSTMIRKDSYTENDRIFLELKFSKFNPKNVDLEAIVTNFENEMQIKDKLKETELPFLYFVLLITRQIQLLLL